MNKIQEHSLLAQNYPGIPATDGAGVKLTRLLGTPELDQIDPFLMLDRIDSDDPDSYIAGFPDHPHRGFETVTFIHDGLMRHRDSVGNEGVLSAGDVQWMTAGKGIIHSEIPEIVNGKLSGFQLWVNLPSTKKMVEPRYQDIVSSEIPENTLENGVERVIAGNHSGILGAAKTHTQVKILDINMEKDSMWQIQPEQENNFFICVYSGSLITKNVDNETVEIFSPNIMLFDKPSNLSVKSGKDGASFLFCEGTPIKEPVARMGPFVMNTQEELLKAVEDYNSGSFAV